MVEITRKKTYTALCERDGAWWVVQVKGVRRAHTQAKRLDQVDEMVHDLLSLLLGVKPTSFDVRLEPILPKELAPKLKEVRKLRSEADLVQERVQRDLRQLANRLAARDLPVRDIGALLGISHQRVSQLLH